jgi:hypothetical protein
MLLAEYARDVDSQFGEDGIIEEMLRRIGDDHLTKWCVEFGAWDGVYLSNTCNLIRAHGYRAVLIEGNPKRASQISANLPGDAVIALNKFVRLEGPDSLDNLLSATPIPERFDVLSIDIDGADYWILESLRRYRPLIIVIEYNSRIPNAVHYVQERSLSVSRGSSARAMVTLARERGYVLAATTPTNLLLVSEDLAPAVLDDSTLAVVGNPDCSVLLALLRPDDPVYVFPLFDGTVCTSKPMHMNWQGITLPSSELLRLPRPFRSSSHEWSRWRRLAWRVYRRLRLR